MARLLSVNVGLPRDIAWHGQNVHTSIWKAPVDGRRMVRRLGDRQGDLAGHGGEQRAVLVYQIASYRYWEATLGGAASLLGNSARTSRSMACPTTRCVLATSIASAERSSR